MKKILLIIALLFCIARLAAAGDFTNEFNVDLGDYTAVQYYGTGSATVSGGECHLNIIGNNAGNLGQSQIEVAHALPLSCFIKFRQASIPGASPIKTCLLAFTQNETPAGASGLAAFQLTPAGRKGRYDNGTFSDTYYDTATYDPLWVWLAVDAAGTITVKYKEVLTDDWALLPQTGAAFNLSGESDCKIALVAVAENGAEWDIFLDYIRDTDPTPTPVATRNPWHGFSCFGEFGKW